MWYCCWHTSKIYAFYSSRHFIQHTTWQKKESKPKVKCHIHVMQSVQNSIYIHRILIAGSVSHLFFIFGLTINYCEARRIRKKNTKNEKELLVQKDWWKLNFPIRQRTVKRLKIRDFIFEGKIKAASVQIECLGNNGSNIIDYMYSCVQYYTFNSYIKALHQSL